MVTRHSLRGPAFGVPDDFPWSRESRKSSSTTKSPEARGTTRWSTRSMNLGRWLRS